MQTFLDKTAKYIFDQFNENTGKLCIVLPNRRAGLFLKKSLATLSGKTIWSPSIYSIEDFITELSGYQVINPVYLQFELYEVHKEIEGTGAQEFGEFLQWGKVLLNDFNEVDMYLSDAGSLFGCLTDSKAMALWNVNGEPLTDFETKYLKFYNSLKQYYDKLNEKLLEKRQVYQGLAFRKFAEQIKKETIEIPWPKILFAGFNALTKSEEEIIHSLNKMGKAEILWDVDHYYFDNKIQEAGRFIRKYKNQFDNDEFNWIEDCFLKTQKEINIIGVPQNIGQVKVTGQLLNEFAGSNIEMHNTAVVLNDETLTVPLLNSIPENFNEFNLTMGLPLSTTPLSKLFESVLCLQENLIKFDKTGGKRPKLYFRDIIRIFEHPYLRYIVGVEKIEKILSNIRNSNKIFIGFNELINFYLSNNENTKLDFSVIFEPWQNSPQIAIERLITFIDILKSAFINNRDSELQKDSETNSLEIEYLFHFSKVFNMLKNLLIDYPYVENIKTFHEIYNQVIQSVSIPFYGEPLKGLQIMGMLETRNLDFENVIMLSANEDFIPSGKSDNSFIPFDIKRNFNLPTYKERNAVFAYHFYRLLQRANNIYLLYNTEPGELGGGDKSRFITQLQYELPKYNPKIKINEKILTMPPAKERISDKIEILKSSDILDKLKDHASNGFSASALNTYRNCSLQFYFKYIAGLDESEDIEETIEASTLGSVVHEVLNKLYKPFEGTNITIEDIKNFKSKIEDFTRKSFEANYENGEINYGKNLLIVKVANIFVNNFLNTEIEFLKRENSTDNQLIIKNLEKKYVIKTPIQINNTEVEISLKGIIDRVDVLGNKIRIIDYKTGRVDTKDLKFKEWEELLEGNKLDKCFQLLFYSYLYKKTSKVQSPQIKPGIISFRNLRAGFLNVEIPEKESLSDEVFEEFENILTTILSEIFNTGIHFRKTDIIDNCKYCPFSSVCNR